MDKLYMIAECVGPSIYESHTISFAYVKREWAEYQLKILQEDAEPGVTFVIREITVVNHPPR